MIHPKLHVYSEDTVLNYWIDWDFINRGIVKTISQLNRGINSSSSDAEVTLSHDCPYSLPIIEYQNDIFAELYEYEDPNNPEIRFTGFVSQDITWTVDSTGEQAVKLKLEDMGTRLLTKPYNKLTSEVISGSVSSCISSICGRCGITPGASTLNITLSVQTVAKAGETCQELLMSLCREAGYAYYFDAAGELQVKRLSTTNLSGATVIDDSDLYGSIKLTHKARKYRGSRVTYTTLENRSNALVYRDITNQSASHKDCWIELDAGDYYPASTTTNIECVDLEQGKEIYYVQDNSLAPTVTWARGNGTSSITLDGATDLAVRIRCTSTSGFNKGAISKLQATANITCVGSTNVVYGAGENTSEDYYDEECRWIHEKTPAEEHANFVAQYYEYCSSEFTFKSKANLTLGQIIKLQENVFSELETYLMIQYIKDTDNTDIKDYQAVSISAFNYSRPTTSSNTSAPPSTTYVEIPDVDSFTTNITTNPSIFNKDFRRMIDDPNNPGTLIPETGRITLYYWWNGGSTVPDTVEWEAKGWKDRVQTTTYTVTRIGTQPSNMARIDVPYTDDITRIRIKGWITNRPETTVEFSLPVEDHTTYNKNWGALTALPAGVVLNGDYFIAGADFGSGAYILGKPYIYDGGIWTNLTGNSTENASRLLDLLGNALNSDLTVPATSALYAWFGTLIAQEAIIQTLFSKQITILNPGYIQSSNYTPASSSVVCNADTSGVQTLDVFAFNESTFISHTWGYGTYRFVCTQGDRYSGTWDLYLGSTRKDDGLSASNLSYYGITLSFDGEGYTAHTGDEIIVTYEEQAVPGQGFYLGSDGNFDCNNSSAYNLTITGDSIFQGRFNTGVLNTVTKESSYTDYSGAAGWNQTKVLCNTLRDAGWAMSSNWYTPNNALRCEIVGVSSGPYYLNYYIGGTSYQIHFWDKNLAELNIRDYVTCSKNGGNYVNYLWSSDNYGTGQWAVGGITLRLYQGGNELEMVIGDKYLASGIPSNCIFKGDVTTINNVQCRPLYIKE